MSKEVDLSKPLSDEDREYMLSRSRYWEVEENDRQFGKGKFAEPDKDAPDEFIPRNTVARDFVAPDSEVNHNPQYVGQRPYGVDRVNYGGSTGLTQEEAEALASAEPNPELKDDETTLAGDWDAPQLVNPESTASATDPDANGSDGKASEEAQGSLPPQEEEKSLEDLNVDELKEELRHRGEPVSGDKAELQKRLRKALKDEEKK